MPHGLIAAALAYGLWGIFPVYIKQIAHVDAVQVVAHRSLWSLLFVFGLLAAWKRLGWLKAALADRHTLRVFAASAALLGVNWGVYVWAVSAGRIVDASLGYFINPLVNVLLGVLVLRERLRPLQWLAVAVAACGVLWLTWQGGKPPWIALALAASFGLYGLMRKTAPLGALEGLALENLLLAPLAVPALLWWSFAHDGVLVAGSASMVVLLLLSGPLTALPLLWFTGAARRLKLATLGLVQYVSPTLQLLLAVWVFHEPFDSARLAGFVLIWSALALVSADALGWRPGARPTRPA